MTLCRGVSGEVLVETRESRTQEEIVLTFTEKTEDNDNVVRSESN